MTYDILGIDGVTLMTLDDVLPDSWREPSRRRDDGLYDVQLNDAWLKIDDGIMYICMDDEEIIFYRNLFVQIIIS